MSEFANSGPWTRGSLTVKLGQFGPMGRKNSNRMRFVPPPGTTQFIWRGSAKPLSWYQGVVLALLVRAPEGVTVSYDTLEWHATGEDASSGIKELVWQLRRALPPAVRIVTDRGRGLQLFINEEDDDMTTIKTKMADQAVALPDDIVAGVMVVLTKEGRLNVVSPGISEVTCTKMLAQGIASLTTARAHQMAAKAQPSAPEEPAVNGDTPEA